jgi:hypothetical protein
MTKRLMLIAVFLVASGCTADIHPGHTRVSVPGRGVIQPDHGHGMPAHHCPPGQAKKGRC